MKHLSIGYVVDHPKRDLPGAMQLAYALQKLGADTYIIPLYEQAIDVPLLPLDAIVVNFARPANLALIKAYRARGLPVFVMDTEGGNHTVAGSNTPERMARALDERGFSPLLSGYFFWGPRLRDVFAQHCSMPPERLHATGCPRFDYASERWKALLERPQRGYVLVNSNYPLINPRFSGSRGAERAAMVSAGWEAAYVDRLVADLEGAFRHFTDNVAQLATDLPDIRFVYRPHPFEDHNFYKNRFSAFANVEVNGEGDALSAIWNARCVLHLNCATAVEASMLRRLPIALEYLNTPTLLNHAPLPSNVSRHARDYADALDLIRNADATSREFDFEGLHERFILPWFYKNDGCAAGRMAAILQEQLSGSEPLATSLWSSSGREGDSLLQHAQGVFANLAGSLAISHLRSRFDKTRRDKNIVVDSVSSALRRLCETEGEPMPEVRRARHPVTGLPLASIHCLARHRTARGLPTTIHP